MRRETKTKKQHYSEFIKDIIGLQVMRTHQYKEYGCPVYNIKMFDNRLYKIENDNYAILRGHGQDITQIKSKEHYIRILTGEDFTVLDEQCDNRYWNKNNPYESL